VGNDDYPDNALRFAFLARAALERAAAEPHPPSLFHAHDWQAGLVPLYLRTRAFHPTLSDIPTVFTIHNIAYQGQFGPEWMPLIDVPPEFFTSDGIEFWGKISFLKAGIVYSQAITTVSRRYAQEILTPEFGFGFEGVLRQRRNALFGILNGIDVDDWDPSRDAYLPASFSQTDLSGKVHVKQALLAAFGLPHGQHELERPLIGMISRLVDQKGFDLIAAIGHRLMNLGASFVVIGTGERQYQDFWRRLAAPYPDRVGTKFEFNERLAHLIEGGADMFLMPSRFEPCGLNQMYSMRYGTVPIVRATGGLDDTVHDYDEATGTGTGFKFSEYSGEALLRALTRGIRVFSDKNAWRRLQTTGMQQDFSWNRSAREYVKVYNAAIAAGGATTGKS
jgi:starch synthase